VAAYNAEMQRILQSFGGGGLTERGMQEALLVAATNGDTEKVALHLANRVAVDCRDVVGSPPCEMHTPSL
jgi:hypothetical protein